MADGFRKAVREIVGVPSLTRNVDELAGKLGSLTGQVGELQGELAALARQVGELKGESAASIQQVIELQKAQLERAPKEAEQKKRIRDFSDEISRCRELSESTIFLLGFARSSTAISTQILNSSKDIFMLGEANFYFPHTEFRFRDWYNRMHCEINNNQVSKTTYAPDFVPEISHNWLDWLCAAKEVYPFVGDKMAFSAQHFNFAKPYVIQSFFEARFFKSKYVFTMRDPLQTLLSTAKLFNISTDHQMIEETIAWLQFVQMWADWLRVFPNTLTFDADELNNDTICDLGAFIGAELSEAKAFIDEWSRTKHLNTKSFPTLDQVKDDLTMIFDLVKAAMSHHPSQWQLSGEKRLASTNFPAAKIGPENLSRTKIFSAWAMCEKLIGELQVQLAST